MYRDTVHTLQYERYDTLWFCFTSYSLWNAKDASMWNADDMFL